MPEELASVFDEAFLRDIADVISDAAVYDREWIQAVTQVKRVHARSDIEKLSHALADEDLSDEATQEIQEKLRTVASQLATLEKDR